MEEATFIVAMALIGMFPFGKYPNPGTKTLQAGPILTLLLKWCFRIVMTWTISDEMTKRKPQMENIDRLLGSYVFS